MHSVLLDKPFLGSSWKAEVVTTHLHALYGDLASKSPASMAREPGSPLSPTAAMLERTARLSDESIGAQLQQLLDCLHFQIMTSSMGRSWNRFKVLEGFLHILAYCGVALTDKEIARLPQLEEEHMIAYIVEKMDESVRESRTVRADVAAWREIQNRNCWRRTVAPKTCSTCALESHPAVHVNRSRPQSPRPKVLRWITDARFGSELVIDTQGFAICFVFARGKAAGGTIDEDETVAAPVEKAKDIFVRKMNADSWQTLEDGFDVLQSGESVTQLVYQDLVRSKFVELCQRTSFKVDTFESIDGDEVFMRVGLDRGGVMIQELAERYRYRMPFTEEAYEDMDAWGNWPGKEPMQNKYGQTVCGFASYKVEMARFFQPFRQVDEIRLILLRLDRWIDLAAMLEQKVMVKYFPCSEALLLSHLMSRWARTSRMLCPPTLSGSQQVRDYFGEEVAFFFLFFSHYIRSVMVLAMVAIAVPLSAAFLEDTRNQRWVQKVFSLTVLFWTVLFGRTWENISERYKQLWGMKDYEEHDIELSSYRPELEGTKELSFRYMWGNMIVIAYLLFYIGLVFTLEWGMKGDNSASSSSWQALALTILIRGLSFGWAKIVPLIARLQNHRTRAARNSSLAFSLCTVKVFIAVFPFFRLAFIANLSEPLCKQSADEVLASIWPAHKHDIQKLKMQLGDKLWSPYPYLYNITQAKKGRLGCCCELRGTLSGTASWGYLSFVSFVWHTRAGPSPTDHQPCRCAWHTSSRTVGHKSASKVAGPGALWQGMGGPAIFLKGQVHDETSCTFELRETLFQFYILQGLLTVVFLLIPVILVKCAEMQESRRAAEKYDESTVEYTLLQYQAKCCDLAPYQFDSWGGSIVEDFLEVVINFALLSMFSVLVPMIAILAVPVNIMVFRLMAFRMTRITCRPEPHGAEGAWLTVNNTAAAGQDEVALIGSAAYCGGGSDRLRPRFWGAGMYITTYPNDVLAWWCRDPEEPRFCPLGKRERVTPAKAPSPTSDPKRPRVDIHEADHGVPDIEAVEPQKVLLKMPELGSHFALGGCPTWNTDLQQGGMQYASIPNACGQQLWSEEQANRGAQAPVLPMQLELLHQVVKRPLPLMTDLTQAERDEVERIEKERRELEQRLVAYDQKSSIGFWESGVRGISQVAVVVNMACNVFLRWPLRDLPFGQKATWFIGLEHVALAVAAAAVYILPLPSDVGVIAKYNEMLKSTLTPYAPLPQPRAEKYDYSRVDIGMAPSTSTLSKRASHPQDQSWHTFW
ncbi:hypothetical protein AK812_SmicGene6722 [Symbiodinium microadriaticum]|uniref:Anoctamin transmembrane domain-containing protein n=1 Tax=Symbiodinium microadriaticum TaxID=2951 RepID=A0A1Q9EQC1_SYMMI|nr:hypothetical protein AK812_SmicGene6722 [Symbiodinium microadriaticum]